MHCKTYTKFHVYYILLFLGIIFAECRKASDLKPINTSTSSNAVVRTGPPNIILIIGDDEGVEVPTYSGGSSYSTPNLDFMASNGEQFSQAYCHPDGFPSRLA